ncbi:CRB_1a_G0054660.mRNA.1.CDS.1 [Saccharomyces cerevisiae]|nr:CRB_1a_G0054660.mRNA.1.CDS.1 [Saccharomyces cerevisiae]CAI7479515.1 CRB_1a_G0054660.mRNA.1.CDS.1 [Saccharomyces cerevisiae]
MAFQKKTLSPLLTPLVSKLLSEEEEKVRLITTKERDWSPNTRPSTTLQSTDWLLDSLTRISSVKSSLLPSLVMSS